ncbi:hypothetical protein LTR86_004504 [Recurvomyces mirabilis]|nr:hypothetical protein LTR86_004504 [Recurvomyces mirabilis]
MSIFKKKSKAEKEKKGSKQDSKKDSKKQAPEEVKPAQAPYKHVPTHAAADAVPRVPHANDHRLSKEANQYANASAAVVNEQPYAQSNGRNNPLPPYRGFNGGFNMQRNKSAEIFTTAPDAPPLPGQSPMPHYNNNSQHNELPRDDSGYFEHQHTAPSFESPMLGNPKMAAAARDRGYINPHNSADSGYGSVGHSRAPSEQGLGSDFDSKPHLPRDNSGFLPELSLSEELAREPAFSEASFGGDEPVEPVVHKQPESVLKNSRSSMREVETGKPSRLSKSYRIQKAKQARFEHATDFVTHEDTQSGGQPDQRDKRISPSQYLPEAVQEVRPESATLPQQQHYSQPQPVRSATPTFGDYDVPRASEPRQTMSAAHRGDEQQTQGSSRVLSLLSARDHDQQSLPMRFASPPPVMHQPPFAPLTQISSAISMGGLEGLKVNKRGKVLDEEGDVIGELVDGDIMDCVRQRCNAYGEVLDDRGRVVGRVQTLDRSMDSPIARVASPALHTPPVTQPQQYFPETSHRLSQTTPSSPVIARSARRVSSASQRETFTPAWQRQSQPSQSGMARELRDHMAAVGTASQQPTQTRDLSQNAGAVELEAPDSQALDFQIPRDEEEVLPIFDYSDVFMPPMVPERSTVRPESPSEHKQRSRPYSQQPETSKAPVPASQPQAEIRQKQSRHVSAPLGSQAYQATPYARSQQPEMQAEAHEPTAIYPGQNQRQEREQEPMTTTPARGSSVAQWAAQLRGTQQPSVVSPPVSRPQSQSGPAQTPAYPVPSSLSQLHQRPVVARNASESSMTDMAKSYSRPTMSPVPEDGSPVETKDFSSMNGAAKSPALFSYKGDIPASDGPQSNAHLAPSRAVGVKSPPLPTFPKQAFTGGLPGGSPFAPMKSAQFSSAGGMGNRPMPPRQFSTGVPGPRSMPGLQTRNSVTRAPLKRSPLSSQENSPPDSDQGSNDGHHNVGIASGGPSRQHSFRSTATNGKPRTYFTHGGRVTVDDGQMTPAQLAAAGKAPAEEKEPTPSVMTEKSKKKSRFSLGFGKKDKS